MADFAKLLDVKADDVKPPEPLPVGTYTCVVTEYEFDESRQKQTPFVRYRFKPIAAQGDVDQELLAKVDGWQEKKLRAEFYLTDDAMYRLKDFLQEAVGINCSGRTLGQCIPEAKNQQVNVKVVHEMNQRDPAAPPYMNISEFSRAA